MSSEIVSPSKLLYTKDFLLRYSSKNQKDESQITDTLTPSITMSPAQSSQPQSMKKEIPKKPPVVNPSNTTTYRNSKTPNPRKTGAQQPVYAQKENMHNQTSKQMGLDSLATPLRKGIFVPKQLAASFKSPPRKTWVTAVEGNGGSYSLPTAGHDTLYVVVSNPLPTPELKAFTPISSPDPKTPTSRKTIKDPFSPSATVTFSETIYLSPKSATSTPFKSPGGTRYSPSKSPRSPARPISPLDEQRLAQRQKQIDYGYRTVGYLRYRLLIAKDQRKPEHPRTPKKTQGCSKRSWDGQLKKWRRDLHLWDPDNADAFKALLNSDLVVSIIAANPELAEIVDIVREKMDNPNPDYEENDSESDFNIHVPSQNGFIEKKLSPPRSGDDTKVQTKVARTLVFV